MMHNLRNIREVELTRINEQLAIEQNWERVKIFLDSFFEYLGGCQVKAMFSKINLLSQDRQGSFIVTNILSVSIVYQKGYCIYYMSLTGRLAVLHVIFTWDPAYM